MYIHSYQYIIHTFNSLFTFRNTYCAIMTHPSRRTCAETICVSTCLAVRRTNVRTVCAIVTFLTYWNRNVDTNINKEMKKMTSYIISLKNFSYISSLTVITMCSNISVQAAIKTHSIDIVTVFVYTSFTTTFPAVESKISR